jgi:hypothetical protein
MVKAHISTRSTIMPHELTTLSKYDFITCTIRSLFVRTTDRFTVPKMCLKADEASKHVA